MTTDESNEKKTVGKTTFYQGENQTHPLFRIEAGIPCQNAREQASEFDDLGCSLLERTGQGADG